MVAETLPESVVPFGRTAVPAGRADTSLRVAIAARRPVRRVVRVARVVLALGSVAGFAGMGLFPPEGGWLGGAETGVTGRSAVAVCLAFGALALIALGGLTSWPLASYGGWGLRAERARVLGDWLQSLTLALGCLGFLVALLDPRSPLALAGGIGATVCVTVAWFWPGAAWLVLAAGAEDRERPVLERYQRLAQRDEIRAQVAREPERFAPLPSAVVLRASVSGPVTLVRIEDDDVELSVRTDGREITLTDELDRVRRLPVGGRALATPDPDAPGGPVASLVVLVAAGLTAGVPEPAFDGETEAGLRRLAGDVDRVALLDASGRRVVDLPELTWSLRDLVRFAGAAGLPCVAYRVDEGVLDRADGVTPTGVAFDLLAAHHPAAPDLVDLRD